MASRNHTNEVSQLPSEEGDGGKITDYLANERTYLAWLRTGIAVIALGFVVAKFALIVKELVPSAPGTSFHFSSYIGIFLVLVGGFMELVALKRFIRNQERIRVGSYQPSRFVELVMSTTIFAISVLLILYLILTL
jgi:inner membrane protein YidH